MKVKTFCAMFLMLLLSPYFLMVTLDYVFVSGDYDFQYAVGEDVAFYYFEGPDGSWLLESQLFYLDNISSYYVTLSRDEVSNLLPIKSGFFLIFHFDDKFHNLRKIVLNISFQDSDISYKLFKKIRVGVGTKDSFFVNVTEVGETFVKSSGKEITFNFDLRDFIGNRKVNAEFLCFDLQMRDDGEPINYFDSGDTIRLEVSCYITEAWRYYNAYKTILVVIAICLIVFDVKLLFMRITPKDVIF